MSDLSFILSAIAFGIGVLIGHFMMKTWLNRR